MKKEEKKKHIIEGNKLIGMFTVGVEFCDDDKASFPNGYWLSTHPKVSLPYQIEDWDFHKDWEFIMVTVEEIEKLGYDVMIRSNYCTISPIGSSVYFNAVHNKKRMAVWEACVQFLEWHYFNLEKLDKKEMMEMLKQVDKELEEAKDMTPAKLTQNRIDAVVELNERLAERIEQLEKEVLTNKKSQYSPSDLST